MYHKKGGMESVKLFYLTLGELKLSFLCEEILSCLGNLSACQQVGAKMGKSTWPVYRGRTVITGCTVVGDMLEWALWVSHTYTVSG